MLNTYFSTPIYPIYRLLKRILMEKILLIKIFPGDLGQCMSLLYCPRFCTILLDIYRVAGPCPQQPNFTPFQCPRQPNFTPFWCPRQPNFTPFHCSRQLLNEYILLAMPGPLEQLSGTPKWSKIWLLGHRNGVKFGCRGRRNEVKFGYWGHPNGVKFQSSKEKKINFLEVFQGIFFLTFSH